MAWRPMVAGALLVVVGGAGGALGYRYLGPSTHAAAAKAPADTVRIPDIASDTTPIRDAVAAVTRARLAYTVADDPNYGYHPEWACLAGNVLDVSPGPGSTVPIGSTVTLYVCPESVRMGG